MSDGQKVLKTKKTATLKYRKLNHTAKRKWLKKIVQTDTFNL